jgi:hypothetical protein
MVGGGLGSRRARKLEVGVRMNGLTRNAVVQASTQNRVGSRVHRVTATSMKCEYLYSPVREQTVNRANATGNSMSLGLTTENLALDWRTASGRVGVQNLWATKVARRRARFTEVVGKGRLSWERAKDF